MPEILLSVEIDAEDAEWLKNVLWNIKNERAVRVRVAVQEALRTLEH